MHTEKIDLYVCDTCGKRFATADKCEECEKAHNAFMHVYLHYDYIEAKFWYTQRPASSIENKIVQYNPCYDAQYWCIDCENTPEKIIEARKTLRNAASNWFHLKSLAADTIDINTDPK